ncbi:MAG: M48 family metalloprotease [Desulfohalobiaceae bacterium]|nr:M48 family metalloprotease [Desulfohalobiaceae bacterium]
MGNKSNPLPRSPRSPSGGPRFISGKLIVWAACSLFVLLLTPAHSRGGFFDFSIQDEVELGREFKVLISSKLPVIHDPEIKGYFNGLLQKISSAMPPQPFSLSITVIKDKSLNAFAAPAGYIFVHSGLILAMEDEAELAGVIAHELAHVSQRHLARRMEQSKLISIGTAVGILAGALLSDSKELGRGIAVGSMAGGQAAALKYTRDDEREADQIGVKYLAGGGFDPHGLLRSFKRIQQSKLLTGVNTPPAYMLTHPGMPERIGYLEDRLAQGFFEQRTAEEDNTTFEKIQMLVRSKYTDPEVAVGHYQRREDLSCLDSLGLGIALERQNRVREAEKYFQKSLDCGRVDPLVNREVGRFFFLTGKYESALAYLEKSISKDPDDYLSLYYKARILKELEKPGQAVDVLQRILGHLPELPEVHSLLGQVYGRKGDRFNGFLHLAYAALYENNAKKTEYYLDKIRPLAKNQMQQEALDRFLSDYDKRKKFW